MKKPKYNIGDQVVALVSRRGSYEPSFCDKGEKMTVDKVERGVKDGKETYFYTCGYNGHRLAEDEVTSVVEYAKQFILG